MGSPSDEEGRYDADDGCPEVQELQHAVTLSPFLAAKYEMTQTQCEKVGQLVRTTQPGARLPANGDWFFANRVCRAIGASLPSEAQWEYACRADTDGPFSGTGALEDMGWFAENCDGNLQPVGKKQANAFGLYDTHGNALEWVFDQWDDEFYGRPEASLPDPLSAPLVISREDWRQAGSNIHAGLRGGSCNGIPRYCRSANRFHEKMDSNIPTHGFRPIISGLIRVE